MKNMKRLISIIAVIAMMLSMATVAFATAIDTSTESFSCAISGADVIEGSTDPIVLRITFEVESSGNAANGLGLFDVNFAFDNAVLTFVSLEASDDLNSGSLVDPFNTIYDGSEGVVKVKYSNTTKSADYKITSDSYFDLTFELADGAQAGDSTTFTPTATSNVNSIKASLSANMGWIPKANFGDYFTSGTVNVISDAPPAPVDPVITEDEGEAGEEGTTVVWGTAANVTPVANGKDAEGHDIYTYTTETGDPVEFGVQITDGEFAGYYPALGLKDGKFAIKFIGNAAADLLTQLYLKIDGVLQDLN